MICWFKPCRWKWAFNVTHYDKKGYGHTFGVYQCCRCKAISRGAEQDHSENGAGPLPTDKERP